MSFTQGGNTAGRQWERNSGAIRDSDPYNCPRSNSFQAQRGLVALYHFCLFDQNTDSGTNMTQQNQKDETKPTQNLKVRLLKERRRKQHGQQVALLWYSICNTEVLLNFDSSSSQFVAIVSSEMFWVVIIYVGVFQYDSGTPKHALELKKCLHFLDFAQKDWILWSGTQGLRSKIQGFK